MMAVSKDFWLCVMAMLFVAFGCAVLGAPSPRLLEMAVCREIYPTIELTHGQEDHCKNHDVQVKLAFILTVLSTSSVLAATLTQIPMGLLADKKGRRIALVMNTASTILYWGSIGLVGVIPGLSTKWFYIAPIFLLFGGGPWASGPLIFAAINSRIATEQRTPAFSIMEAVSGIADLVGPVLGALTMEVHIWIPFALATASFVLMFVPVLMLEKDAIQYVGRSESVESGSESTEAEQQSLLPEDTNESTPPVMKVLSSFNLLRSPDTIFAATLVSFFLLSFSRDSNSFLIPWASWRFDESMARAGLLFSLRAVVSLIVFFIILPLVSSLLRNHTTLSPRAGDLLISTACVGCCFVGYIIMAFAPQLWTLVVGFATVTLGSGVIVSLRAFLASRVDRSSSGRLFATIATISTFGSFVGMPVMGAAYAASTRDYASHVGLPFLVSGIANGLILGIFCYV